MRQLSLFSKWESVIVAALNNPRVFERVAFQAISGNKMAQWILSCVLRRRIKLQAAFDAFYREYSEWKEV